MINDFIFDTHTKLQNEFIEKIHKQGIELALEWVRTAKNWQECTYPNTLKLTWDEQEKTNEFKVEISETENFINAFHLFTNESFCEITNLKVNQKYYWRVNSGNTHCFQTCCDAPRFIKLEGAINVRDLGGKK